MFLCTVGAFAQTDIRIDPLDLAPPTTNGIWVQPAQGTKAQAIWGFADGITDILGRKNLTKGVKVDVGSRQAAIDLAMIMEYGVKIPEVARNVQENVKKAIETMTGLRVVEVNVYVQGVSVEKEIKEKEPKEKPEKVLPEPRVR